MTKSIAEILAEGKDSKFTRVVTAKIPRVPQALRDEHADLDARLRQLHKERDTVDYPPELLATRDRLLEIEAEIEAALVEFRFKSIGHRAWQDLLRDHPPTQKQVELNLRVNPNQRIDHNPDSFPYEAMAASCSDPVMTADQVKELASEEWVDEAAWMELWGSCLQANVAAKPPKSRAAAGLTHLLSVASEPPPTNSVSHAVSSSAE